MESDTPCFLDSRQFRVPSSFSAQTEAASDPALPRLTPQVGRKWPMKKLPLLLLALLCTLPLFALIDSAPLAQEKKEICNNGVDDDGDKLVDCADPDCKCHHGKDCSPGFWKNHEDAFNQFCEEAAAIPGNAFSSCDDLRAALNCKGSNADCKRSAAAAALNQVSGCKE